MLKPVVLVTLLLGQISLELLQAALCDIARCRALGRIDPRLADGDDELDELVQLRDRELMVLVWVEMPDVVREPKTCVRESSRSGHEPREQDVQRCFHARHSRARARGASAGKGVFKVCDLSRCEAVGQGQVAVLGVRELMNLPGFETLVTVLLRVSRSRRPRVQRALYPDSRRSIPWSVHARETGTPVPCRTLRVAPTHR